MRASVRLESEKVAMQNDDTFSCRVIWSDEDGEHVGLCAEFPSLSWLAQTPEAALAQVEVLQGAAIRLQRARRHPGCQRAGLVSIFKP